MCAANCTAVILTVVVTGAAMSIAYARVPGTVLHTGRLLQCLPSGGCDDYCCSQKMNLGG